MDWNPKMGQTKFVFIFSHVAPETKYVFLAYLVAKTEEKLKKNINPPRADTFFCFRFL